MIQTAAGMNSNKIKLVNTEVEGEQNITIDISHGLGSRVEHSTILIQRHFDLLPAGLLRVTDVLESVTGLRPLCEPK